MKFSLRNIVGVPPLLASMIAAAVVAVPIGGRVAAPVRPLWLKEPTPGA